MARTGAAYEETTELTPRRARAMKSCRCYSALCRAPEHPLRRRLCAVAFLATSSLLILVAALSIALMARFSPVYRPVRCVASQQAFGAPQFPDGRIHVDASATMVCRSDNPYAVSVSNAMPGRVLINQTVAIGSVFVRDMVIPARGQAQMVATISLSIPMSVGLWLMQQHPAEVLIEMRTQATAAVPAFVTTFSMDRQQVALCGFAMEALTVPKIEIRNGPPTCARTVSELHGHIPPIGSNQTVAFELGPAPEELNRIQASLYAGCGVALALAGCTGLALAACASRLLCWSHGKTLDGDESKAPEEPSEESKQEVQQRTMEEGNPETWV